MSGCVSCIRHGVLSDAGNQTNVLTNSENVLNVNVIYRRTVKSADKRCQRHVSADRGHAVDRTGEKLKNYEKTMEKHSGALKHLSRIKVYKKTLNGVAFTHLTALIFGADGHAALLLLLLLLLLVVLLVLSLLLLLL